MELLLPGPRSQVPGPPSPSWALWSPVDQDCVCGPTDDPAVLMDGGSALKASISQRFLLAFLLYETRGPLICVKPHLNSGFSS